MHFLPIVERELFVSARRFATYRRRVIVGGTATALVVFYSLMWPPSQSVGARLFYLTLAGSFIFCLLEGLRVSSDSIARERREGTLGLLLLTDLRGIEIVLGKFAAAAVQSVTVVLSFLPAFALPLLMGGVTGGESSRAMLLLLVTLLLALSSGILASALESNSLMALLAGCGFIAGLTFPALIWSGLSERSLDTMWWLTGPVGMFVELTEKRYSTGRAAFWKATGLSVGAALAMLGAAAFLLQHNPRIESRPGAWRGWRRWFRPARSSTAGWGGPAASEDPAVWLAEATLPGKRLLWITAVVGALLSFLFGLFGGDNVGVLMGGTTIFFAYLIKLWAAAVAPQSLHESRRSGALELLLCTPLRPAVIIRGQIDVLIAYFFLPALMIALLLPASAIIGAAVADQSPAELEGLLGFILPAMGWLVLFMLDLNATIYVGLWFGLTHARIDAAVARTIFVVLVLPWLTVLIPVIGCLGIVGWPIFWIFWASRRLNHRFREEATRQLSSSEEMSSSWWPWPKTRPMPSESAMPKAS